MAAKLLSGDEVIILTGKDKGKRGIIKSIESKNKLIIERINLMKIHKKSIPTLNKVGGILIKEAPIHISNVAIYNKNTGKADKIGFKLHEGKKKRFFKKNNQFIED
ncbi:MAG: 50S ribosomal protein L24 [Candidatus Dasytiphilus stammeri]